MDLARLLGDPGAFEARYQPIVSVATREPAGWEALLHPADRSVTPGSVFAAAAAAGRLADLDRIARESAVRGASGWLGDALLFVKLSVAPGDLPADWLVSTQLAAKAAGVPLGQVVLEVVQPRPGEPLERTARVVTRCRGAGCKVALVGASDPRTVRSLAGSLLPDYVTLDRSLVNLLPGGPAADVVAAVGDMAEVIAFGVESEAQHAAVAARGVGLAQGWLYGVPLRR